MKYYHIKNLIDQFGRADYKGLDIEKFIAGSQVYFGNECLIATDETVSNIHHDLIEITEQEYMELRQEFEASYMNAQETLKQKVEQHEQEIAMLWYELMKVGE